MLDTATKHLMVRLVDYVNRVLGVRLTTRPWPRCTSLPAYLRDRYRFCTGSILDREYVFVLDPDDAAPPPAAVAKHLAAIQATGAGEAVYVRVDVTASYRQRLIGQRLPFIIPGNQLHLPSSGMDLREHFRRTHKPRSRLNPSTQDLLLQVLLTADREILTAARAAERTGYTAMTISRAFRELEDAGLAERLTVGRERPLRFLCHGRALWDRALPHLNTPVRKVLIFDVSTPPPGSKVAGESALARLTDLAEPSTPVFACSAAAARRWMRRNRPHELVYPEPGAITLQLWSYPPPESPAGDTVDPLSLYLATDSSDDERLQAARDDLLEGFSW